MTKEAVAGRAAALIALMFGAPLVHAQSYSRTEVIQYHDDLTTYVLGQVASVTCTASVPAHEACDGGPDSVVSRTDFGWKALPWKTYSFNRLEQTFSYETTLSGQVGTLKTVTDGNGNVTTLTNWKRGIPQAITYPATPESPGGAIERAEVDDAGWIRAVRDETDSRTCYEYDSMGRVRTITYPSETKANTCDTSKWAATVLTFSGGHLAAYGVPAGHWRQTIQTGNGRRTLVFDALWRPVVDQSLDLGNVANTISEVLTRYDSSGRLAFQSYPMRTNGAASVSDLALKGTHTTYDALDRVTEVRQDWEGPGQLKTTTEYLAGSRTRVTPPRGQGMGATFQTVTEYLAFDQPTTDWPVRLTQPEAAVTEITRDVFGKPTMITRRNASSSTLQRRYYHYNAHQQLCKSKETEVGATAYGYDGAGNLAWSASGLPLTYDNTCEFSSTTAAARRVDRTYDARNWLRTISFPDGRGNQTWTYTPDGLAATISTVQADPSAASLDEYRYNRRRLLTGERQTAYAQDAWLIARNYNANGHLSDLTYPSGLNVAYFPNALGQATRAGMFATGVSYHPNGAISQFTYGNGIVHSLTQNVRGLPDTSCDHYGTCNASAFLYDGYDYDQSGNVAAISDGRAGGRGHRTMAYDALDRLTSTVSPMFGTAAYAYDALDNLTRVTVGTTAMAPARDHFYCYDSTWRLTNVKTGGCSGATVVGLGYDVQGNVTNKNGATYQFDFSNRLRSRTDSWRSYSYDGHGRRQRETIGSRNPLHNRFMYGVDGRLFYTNRSSGSRTDSIYLGNSLIAQRTRPIAVPYASESIWYQHTDALGSPVIVTDSSRTVFEQSEYEPYGFVGNRAVRSGIGYTGHVEDTTGLVYMQQRYYDPQLGVFLSVDPVTAYQQPISQFNRYRYANNNPYGSIDPDGRQPESAMDRKYVYPRLTTEQVSAVEAQHSEIGKQAASGMADGALVAAGGAGGATVARLAVSRLSNGAKGGLGEAVTRVGIALRGEKVVASQTPAGKVPELGEIAGRAARAVPDFVVRARDGAVKVVEAKFNTSGLTGAQRALRNLLGPTFTISRTTMGEVAAAGAAVGGGGASAAVLLNEDEP